MRRDGSAIRWLKFNAVGGVGILVQLAVLAVLTGGFGIGYLVSTALAVEAAIVHNFFWHERFTWGDRWTPAGSMGRFLRFNFSTGVLSISGNLLLMKLFAGLLNIPYLPANGLSIVTCSLFNFLVSDRFVFTTADGTKS